MKPKDKIAFTGIWTFPILLILLIRYFPSSNQDAGIRMYLIYTLYSLIPTFLITIHNSTAYSNGKREFGLFDFLDNKSKAEYISSNKKKAMYPPVPSNMISKEVKGILFGRYNGSYVYKDIKEDGHILIVGGSGSGKSSCLVIPTILANKDTQVFAIDIKGELSSKTSKYDDEHTIIFNPLDKNTYGYNPLYNITEESPIQDIYEVMQNISFSLIPLPAGLTEIFWKQSARNLLTGLLIYFFNQGCNTLIEIVDNILSLPIKQIIDHAIDSMNDKYVEYKILIQYKDMSENTLTGIYSELSLHISIFANDENIRYAFSQNPKMFSPLMLEEQYNIYLSIKEEKLTAYYDILQLIINQALMQLEKRPENSSPVIFIIDELPRILSSGKLDRLLDGARTLRSRKVSLILVTQSIEALMTAYGENEVIDLISNCSYKIILSASSSKTQDMICKWCGKYKEQHNTFDKHTKKSSMSYEDKDIVEASDLMLLQNTGELILVSPYGYNRIKKIPYYKDKAMNELVTKNQKYNCQDAI